MMRRLVSWLLSKLAPVPLTPFEHKCRLFPPQKKGARL